MSFPELLDRLIVIRSFEEETGEKIPLFHFRMLMKRPGTMAGGALRFQCQGASWEELAEAVLKQYRWKGKNAKRRFFGKLREGFVKSAEANNFLKS